MFIKIFVRFVSILLDFCASAHSYFQNRLRFSFPWFPCFLCDFISGPLGPYNFFNLKFARFVPILFDFSPLGDSFFQNRLRFSFPWFPWFLCDLPPLTLQREPKSVPSVPSVRPKIFSVCAPISPTHSPFSSVKSVKSVVKPIKTCNFFPVSV